MDTQNRASQPHTAADEIDIKALLYKLVKHRKIIIYAVAAAALIGLITAFTATPQFRASATVLLEPDASTKLVSDDSSQVTSFILRKEYMETQKEILHSLALARTVARKLKLEEIPAFNPQNKKPSAGLYEAMGVKLQGMISSSFIKDTRLVKISAVSANPVLARDVANSMVDAYKEFIIEKKFATTRDTVSYLESQTKAVKEKLALKEQQLQNFGSEKKIYYVKEDNTMLSQYADLNSAFSQAQIEKIKAESMYTRLKKMRYADFPAVISNPVIQRLKEQYAALESEYTKKKETFKADYPEVRDLRAQLTGLTRRMEIETRNIAEKHLKELQNTFQSFKEKEEKLREQMTSYQNRMNSSNQEVVTYNSIRIEVENLKNLLTYMTSKLNETIVTARLAGLTTSNIKVVDRARLPESPFKPRKKLILLIALFLGAAAGVGVVFVLDFFRDTISSAEEVKRITGKPILAAIPDMKDPGGNGYSYRYKYGYGKTTAAQGKKEIEKPELLLFYHPDHIIAENYRTLRTSLMFSRAGQSPKIIAVTSSLSLEGKTTTVSNLALSFAKLGEKVLIVDADLRRPKLHKVFQIKNHDGLSEMLIGKINSKRAIKDSRIKDVYFINSGTIPPNPSELLNAPVLERMLKDLEKDFDRILIDTPPIGPVVDPLIIARLAHGLVLTVARSECSRRDLTQSMEKLRNAGVSLLGVVDNRVESLGIAGLSRYKHYKYRYTQKA